MVFETLEPRCLLTAQTAAGVADVSILLPDADTYDASRIIVTFRDGLDLSAVQQLTASTFSGLAAASDGRTIGSSDRLMDGIYEVVLAPGVTVVDALALYRADPDVLIADPNYLIKAEALPNDPFFGQEWGLNNTGQLGGTIDVDIDAPEAWNIATGSGNFIIAVLDTGVDYTHPDLRNNIWTNPGEIAGNGRDDDRNGFIDDIHGWDFVGAGDNDPLDDNLHGTHVAGTIAAQGNNGLGVTGVNWNAKIMALKFLGADGFGTFADAIQAIDYSLLMGAKVSNNSWGGFGNQPTLLNAIMRARASGQIFVAAAGNESLDIDNLPISFPEVPGGFDLDNIVTVAAIDRNGNLASFSNYGVTKVDLAAPGVDVLSTFPTYTTFEMDLFGFSTNYEMISGTSMATPHVAGAMALIWDSFPNLTYRQVIDVVLNSVDPMPVLAGKVATGGRLNLNKAMLAASAIPGPPDPFAIYPPAEPAFFALTISNTTDFRIPDRKSATSPITVSQSMQITDVNVWVDIRHPTDKQLRIYLYRPGSPAPVKLVASALGNSGDHYSVTTFDDEAAMSITDGAAPFNGSFKPQNSLTAFDGFNAFGTWKLVVSDTVKGSVGLINGWGITIIGTAPGTAAAVSLNWSFDATPSGADQAALLAASEIATASRPLDAGKVAAQGCQLAVQRFAERPALKISPHTMSPAAVDRYFAARRSEARTDIPEITLHDDECGQMRLVGIEAA